jgi:hypothetical protein
LPNHVQRLDAASDLAQGFDDGGLVGVDAGGASHC